MNLAALAVPLAATALLGCGARSDLDPEGACLGDGCDPPRVGDCLRRDPAPTPLAVIRDVGTFRFTMDADALYFPSEGRIHRLPLGAGAAAPLTPEPAAQSTAKIRGFDVAGGTLVWLEGDSLEAMAVGGGAVRTLAEMPDDQSIVVALEGHVVTAGFSASPEDAPPVYRVPLGGGAPEQLLAAAPVVGAARDEATGRALLATRSGLIAVDPTSGAVEELSHETSHSDPAAEGGDVFDLRPATDLSPGIHTGVYGIARMRSGQAPEQIARGVFVSIAADEDDVVFDGLLGDPDAAQAAIGLVPRDGSAPVTLATSDSKIRLIGELAYHSRTVRSDGKYVYFAQICLDRYHRELRLVRVAKHD